MTTSKGFWRSLDALPTGEAVLAEWRQEMGNEFAVGCEYLSGTGHLHSRHPCTSRAPCGCQHKVVHLGGEKFSGVCSCPEADCPAFPLRREDLLLHRVVGESVGDAVRRALGLEKPNVKLRDVLRAGWGCIAGSIGPKRHPAVLLCCVDESELLAQMDELLEIQMECGLIMTPTPRLHTDVVVGKVRRNKCALLALSEFLVPMPDWEMRVVRDIAPVLDVVGRVPGRARTAAKTKPSEVEVISCGKLRFLPGFEDLWFGDEHYDLRERTMARLCIQYLVEQEAFDRNRGRHLLNEIDPYVRKHSGQPPAADVRIDHYFIGPKGRLRKLRKDLIKAVGLNGKFFLQVK